jgi:cation transport ATPase
MHKNPNPYRGSTVSSAENQPTKGIASTFAKLTLAFTFVQALLLIGIAIYNVSLWQNGAQPQHSLSLKIMSAQLLLCIGLFGSIFYHFIAAIILLVTRKPESAILSVIGFVLSVFAIAFTMFYDQGSIFVQ